MRAAVKALRQQQPARIVVAVPVAAPRPASAAGGGRRGRLRASRRSRSTPSASGTRTSRRPPTRRSATCWPRRGTEDAPEARAEPERRLRGSRRCKIVRERRPSADRRRRTTTRSWTRIGDARFVLLGEASHGTHEFYRERARITRRLIERTGLQRGRRRGRLARRLPRQPLRARPERRRCDAGERWPASGASRPGCGATPTWSSSSSGCAPTTTLPRRRAKAGFYGLDLYSLRARSRRCSATSTRSIPRRRGGRARATPASTTSARTRRPTASCRPGRPRIVRGRGRQPAGRAAAPAMEYARRDGRVAEDELFYAEQNARLVRDAEAYYRSMFLGGGVVVEPARPPHGRDARRAGRATSSGRVGAPRSSSGRTTRTSATRGPPRWARRGELNVGQLVRERHGRRRGAGRLHHLPRHRHRRLRLGGPAERKRVRPALPAATRRCSTPRDRRASCSPGATATRLGARPCASRGSSGRSA